MMLVILLVLNVSNAINLLTKMATNQPLSSHKHDVINLEKSTDSCKTAANDVNEAEAENVQNK